MNVLCAKVKRIYAAVFAFLLALLFSFAFASSAFATEGSGADSGKAGSVATATSNSTSSSSAKAAAEAKATTQSKSSAQAKTSTSSSSTKASSSVSGKAAEVRSGTCGTCAWTIDANGKLTIKAGTLSSSGIWPWADYADSITSVVFEGNVNAGTSTYEMFAKCFSLTSIDFTGFNTANVTNMDSMFFYCTSLKSLDLRKLNTSKVTNIYAMFGNCLSLKSIDLSNFNTGNVVYFDNVFQGCGYLTTIKVGSNFNFYGNGKSGKAITLPGTYWKSAALGKIYSASQIQSKRNKTADTYTQVTDEKTRVDKVVSDASVNASLNSTGISAYVTKSSTVMPGLTMTCLINGICTSMVPQGICEVEGYKFVSAYCSEKEHNSVVYVLNSSGKYLKTLETGYKYHVGSIAYDKSKSIVYVAAGETEKKVLAYSLPKLVSAIKLSGDCARISEDYVVTVDNITSCIAVNNGRLCVGTFAPNDNTATRNRDSKIVEYDVPTSGNPRHAKAVRYIQLYAADQFYLVKVQGFAYQNYNYLILSRSNGAGAASQLMVVRLVESAAVNGKVRTTAKKVKTITAPDMMEDIALNSDGTLSVVFESAADAYKNRTDKTPSKWAIDRIVTLNTKAIMKGITNSLPVSKLSISSIGAKTYNGSKITPVPKVKYNGVALAEKTNFTLVYKNNKSVGTATVTLKGKGDFYGSKDITFKINKRAISSATASAIKTQQYTGKAITPNPVLKYNGKKLVKGTDYTISNQNNKKIGKATITIKGKGNFKGTKKLTFKIDVGSWKKVGKNWRYKRADGTYAKSKWELIDGKYYRFDKNGNMLTGWVKVSKKWYYLDSSGARVQNKWVGDYYLQKDGTMATSRWIGFYYVGKDGRWVRSLNYPKK